MSNNRNETIEERIPASMNNSAPPNGKAHNKTIEERISVREEIKILEEDIKRLKDNIEGKENLADSDWHKYKQSGHKKYFIGASRKYKECSEMKGALRDLEREKEFYQNKWNQLKKAA